MRVLVVEDHELLARTIGAGLRREGMAVDIAVDGGRALELLDFAPYDVMVLDRDLPTVSGDDVCRGVGERGLPTLAGNLLDNAIRYNRDGGRVDVATAVQGTRAVLAISNTGPVVPADEVDRILRPFQRLAVGRTPGAGSGLGLAIVRAIADSHGARLWVAPNPAGGLTVTVAFATP